MKFLSEIVVMWVGSGSWSIYSPLKFELGGEAVEIPVGFVTDFASVPKLLHWLVSPHGEYSKAALVHDWLYRNQMLSRKQSDAIFLEGMRVLGVWKPRRLAMYYAVRAFGWLAWK